jgi:hypothetical protein
MQCGNVRVVPRQAWPAPESVLAKTTDFWSASPWPESCEGGLRRLHMVSGVPFANVYMGPLSVGPHPLDWGGENRPAAFRPYSDPNAVFFPPSVPDAFCELLDRIYSGEVQARRVDWNCWAAKMPKRKIIAFINEIYISNPYLPQTRAETDSARRKRVDELLAFVQSLPDDEFAIIAVQDG